MCHKYANNTNFYERRLFIPMFEEALNLFSINFIKKSLLLQHYFTLLKNNPLIINRMLKLLPQIYPLIYLNDSIKIPLQKEISIIIDKVNDHETYSVYLIFNINIYINFS